MKLLYLVFLLSLVSIILLMITGCTPMGQNEPFYILNDYIDNSNDQAPSFSEKDSHKSWSAKSNTTSDNTFSNDNFEDNVEALDDAEAMNPDSVKTTTTKTTTTTTTSGGINFDPGASINNTPNMTNSSQFKTNF